MIQIKNYEKAKQFFLERMYCWFRIKTVGKKSKNNPNGHECNCVKEDICNYNIYKNHEDLSDNFKNENILKKILQSKPNELVNIQFN